MVFLCVRHICGYHYHNTAHTYTITHVHCYIMLKSSCGLSCIMERMPRVKCQRVLSCEIWSYICLICLYLPLFLLTGEYAFNPKPPMCWVQYPSLLMTDNPRRKKTVARACATLHSWSHKLSLSFSLPLSLKQVFLTWWSLDTLQWENASPD